MQAASKNLMDTLTEVYEPQWPGQDLLTVQGQNSEMLWADLAHKLSDQVLIPLNTYQGQFPEMRKKIEKRGRKLIDFDKERHNVQTLQANPNRNEAKYARYAKRVKKSLPLFYRRFHYVCANFPPRFLRTLLIYDGDNCRLSLVTLLSRVIMEEVERGGKFF